MSLEVVQGYSVAGVLRLRARSVAGHPPDVPWRLQLLVTGADADLSQVDPFETAPLNAPVLGRLQAKRCIR